MLPRDIPEGHVLLPAGRHLLCLAWLRQDFVLAPFCLADMQLAMGTKGEATVLRAVQP